MSYADPAIVETLAINVKSGIPPQVMSLATGMADRYLDAQLSKTFLDWRILTLAPELIPEQAVIAASMMAAGRVEQMMFAASGTVRENKYGSDLEEEGSHDDR